MEISQQKTKYQPGTDILRDCRKSQIEGTMRTMGETLQRLPVKGVDGSIDLIEVDGIFYLEARGGDTLIHTRRKKPYHCVQRLKQLALKLPGPAFVRCHRQYVVNLNRKVS